MFPIGNTRSSNGKSYPHNNFFLCGNRVYMGNCFSTEDDSSKARSNAIDRQIEEDSHQEKVKIVKPSEVTLSA
jgi:hypothetical protein